ncbi:flagellar basal-body MS-ring/collar protein FliF [Devosia sp. J2-20]|nr:MULTISPECIES: flagellar basal-body MS-ring/collar protein FliF [Devosia]MCZ4346668.1 flagellar basal-body MS-ring/collar protein FliF [Devosia neptuniae]WDR01141.1 flagellar basal-body MS-ring/collar protein FliF [Devosia sp. J2-20]|tara:strand:+ start:2695 stop:4269 length:1575 start_codon:yes stop_codon:yes gene_type:complete
MATVAVLMLGFFAFLIMRAQTPNLAPLYTGLSLEDSSAIISELQTMNTPYELRGEGDTILVPRDQITTLRMTLAGSGLPQRGQVGYEIFDQQSTLGATSFVQNINNVRALEGELARTINSLTRIKSARVHLVLPERELFRRERKDPTASIVLSVRGELASGEIRAIQHMVSSAIEGMSPTHVAIVDDQGNLLASGSGDDAEGALSGQAAERTLSYENRMRTRVEDMLANVVGAGRARVEVSAEIDFNRSTTTQETFDPESQVVRSSQIRETENLSGGADGQVTVANELPGASGNNGNTATEKGTSTEEVTNYEISKTTQTAVTEAGQIKRLSVAVVVDGVYTDEGDGNVTYAPRSAEEVTQILTLVRSAVGYSETRGDSVEVVNMQFAERPELAAPGTDASGGLLDFTRDDLMNGAEMAVTLLIALALVFFVMRPLLKKVLTPETKPLSLPSAAEVGHAGTLGPDGRVINEEPDEPKDKTPAWVANAKSMGETQLQTLKMVGDLVEENPKQAALIVRDWLGSAA